MTEDQVPTPIDYDDLKFGESCSSLTDQECGDVNCIQCAWSWPKWDEAEFESIDAMCRC